MTGELITLLETPDVGPQVLQFGYMTMDDKELEKGNHFEGEWNLVEEVILPCHWKTIPPEMFWPLQSLLNEVGRQLLASRRE
ncbi:MAG: hypothetical protein KDA57_18635 [Planctomycetales bacterium]|nr:hypothetical protein [Planctomycetales bacterium]